MHQQEPILVSLKATLSKYQQADLTTKMLDELKHRLVSPEYTNLLSFTEYLQDQCAIKPRTIIDILHELGLLCKNNRIVCSKIKSEYSLFKIYETMGLLNYVKDTREEMIKMRTTLNLFHSKGKQVRRLVCDYWQSIQSYHQNESASIQKYEQEIRQKLDFTSEQKLKDLIDDYNQIVVDCFQKKLQKQIILAFIQIYPQGQEIVDKILHELIGHTNQIEQLIKAFREQQKCYNISRVQNYFGKIRQSRDALKLYQSLCALKAEAFSVNISELSRLINKTKQAEKLIEGKDILLFIGNTGVGKSTLILKFLGYNFKQGEYQQLKTLIPIEELAEQHKSFLTCPLPKSCTRYINSVMIPEKMYSADTNLNEKNLLICDSPGFGDTAGVQVDMANSMGTLNALRKVKSVRIVLIIPYESIIASRAEGLIPMVQTMSNIFDEKAIDCVKILFNKVPLRKKGEVEALIKSKIQHSNLVGTMKKLLDLFYQCSKDHLNYIDPLKTNILPIFNKIRSIKPLLQTRHLTYQFSSNTKARFRNFIHQKADRVQKLIVSNKFEQAKYRINLFQKLKILLDQKPQVSKIYKSLRKFVDKKYSNQMDEFKKIVQKTMMGLKTDSLRQMLLCSYQKLIRMQKCFQQINSRQTIQQIIKNNGQKLIKCFDNTDEVTIKTIQAVKLFQSCFSAYFDLSDQVLKKLKKQIIRNQNIIKKYIKEKKLSQIREPLYKLRNLIMLLSQIDENPQAYDNKIKQIVRILSKRAEQCITQIGQNREELQYCLYQRQKSTALKINVLLQEINSIQTLDFIENSQQIGKKKQHQLRIIESQCKKQINQLRNLKFNGQTGQKDKLLRSKNYIESLMNIQVLRQNLKDYYTDALTEVKQTISKMVQTLQQIAGQRNGISESIHLDKISKYAKFLMECSYLIDQNYGSQKTEQIQKQLIQYFKLSVKRFDQRRYLASYHLTKKIQDENNKIYSLSKIAISQRIKQEISLYKKQFLLMLKVPFAEQKKKIIQETENRHYKYLVYKAKLQRITYYALQMERILQDDYQLVKEEQECIILYLDNFCIQMKKDLDKFISLQFQNERHPSYLKQLIRTLIHIKQSKSLCEYIYNKIDFDVQEHLNYIERKLDSIKQTLQKQFHNFNESPVKLQKLIIDCKFYGQIERVYNLKKSSYFSNLQQQCFDCLNSIMKEKEDGVVQLIRGNYSRRYYFEDLKTYYSFYSQLSDKSCRKGRQVIRKQLSSIERNQVDELKRFYSQMGDISFFGNKNRVQNFKQKYQQVIQLQCQMKDLYTSEEDRKYLFKKPILRKIKGHINELYRDEFYTLLESIKCYNTISKSRLAVFDSIESALYEIIKLQEKHAPQESKDSNKQLITFVNEASILTIQQIQSHQKENKLNINQQITLKKLLQIYNKRVNQEIRQKYSMASSAQFIIDSGFLKYYGSSKGEKRQQLQELICIHAEALINRYKNCAKQSRKELKEKIITTINILPNKQKIRFQDLIKEEK